jgi:hypothetical protein
MADDPASVRDATVPPEDFHDVVESAGVKLKAGLLVVKDSATKGYGFDSYAIQPFMDILEPVLCHEVSDKNPSAKRNHPFSTLSAGTQQAAQRWEAQHARNPRLD